jgi:hypothetical protein
MAWAFDRLTPKIMWPCPQAKRTAPLGTSDELLRQVEPEL